MFSQEELRLADYQFGRRFVNFNPTNPLRYGLFGNSLSAPPLIAPIRNMFGTVRPAPSQAVSVPTTSGLFAMPQAAQSTTATNMSVTELPQTARGGFGPTFTPSNIPVMQIGGLFSKPPTYAGDLFDTPPSQIPSGNGLFTPMPLSPASHSKGFSLFSTPQSAQSSVTLTTPATIPASTNPFVPSRGLSRPNKASKTTQASKTNTLSTTGVFAGGILNSNPQNSGLFGGAPSQVISSYQPGPLFGHNQSFGHTPLIEYPKSSGVSIPGILRSDSMAVQSAEQQNQQRALLHLCLLAEITLWPELYNVAIEAYVRGELNLHRPIPPEHVDLIYRRTPRESTLRVYVLKSMCRNRGDSTLYMDLTREYDDLMEDVLKQLSTARPPVDLTPWGLELFFRSFYMPVLINDKETDEKDVEVS